MLFYFTSFPALANNQEELKLIQQVQSGNISNTKLFELYLSYMNGFPDNWKLAIYHFLSKLPFPEISKGELIILIGFFQFLTLAVIIGLVLLFYRLIKKGTLLRILTIFVLFVRKKEKVNKVILNLTFPANTIKSAYATEELYMLLHTLSSQNTFFEKLRHRQNEISFEIISTKKEGIRYQLVLLEYLLTLPDMELWLKEVLFPEKD